ncbi:heparinase II/III domain-containing protein [Aequorivita marisscotiae]|uniref:Heparinase II/III family protein n=1 Tax=Aequorivita marisscotiae TaxID=3040348 RepID=A0ABY8KVJ1_9FLAO|nr:heparinase II/III family protein [Aequorivita sp. Ant34-E75]WGF93439.1 heparinase II/III family protein [Aequorivita sp. Ant34-E75]
MKRNYFIILTPLILLIACNSNSTDSNKIEKLKDTAINITPDSTHYALSLYDISKELRFDEIPRTVPYDSIKNKRYADLIMKDSIVVMHSFKPFYIPIDQITWSENPEKNNTWQNYYEALFFVSILNHAYHDYGKETYHEKAKKYIFNYIDKHPSLEEKTSEYTWYDHAVAFRTLHLLQTVANELDESDPDTNFIHKAFSHISLNVTFMMDPKNYKSNNHSLMMDRTLLYLAKITKSDPPFYKKIYYPTVTRTEENIDKIIDPTGLAREHSTTYHIFNHNLNKSILKFIEKDDINPAFQLKMLRKNDVLLQLVKPDLTFPLWGDSQMEILNAKLADDFGNDQRVLDLLTVKKLPSMVNFDNNIATLRSQKADNGYVALFANFYSRVHKHNDDLSFIFQTLGVDILTDQGYFGYEKEHRQFLISVFAHNSIAVNNEDYWPGKKGQYSKLTGYSKSDDVEIVSGEHNMYDSITVKRKLYFIKPNVIVLQDWAETDYPNLVKNISQQFNFGEKATDAKVSENSAIITFPKNMTATVTSFINNDKITLEESYRSRIQYSKVPIYQIKVQKASNKLITVIEVQSPAYKNPVSNISIQEGEIKYIKDSQKHTLPL